MSVGIQINPSLPVYIQNISLLSHGWEWLELIDFVIFSEADKLCGRLYQKLNLLLGQKIVMDHMPLLMVCLEVGQFFTISKNCIFILFYF